MSGSNFIKFDQEIFINRPIFGWVIDDSITFHGQFARWNFVLLVSQSWGSDVYKIWEKMPWWINYWHLTVFRSFQICCLVSKSECL